MNVTEIEDAKLYQTLKDMAPKEWQDHSNVCNPTTNGEACQIAEWAIKNRKKLLKLLKYQ